MPIYEVRKDALVPISQTSFQTDCVNALRTNQGIS